MHIFSTLFGDCLKYTDLFQSTITIKEAEKQLANEAILWSKNKKKQLTIQFWEMIIDRIDSISHPLLIEHAKKYTQENDKQLIAVDLGSAISASAITLLISKWKVYTVDISQKNLDTLRAISKDFTNYDPKSLITACCKVEDFKFPKNVKIIFGHDIFPYCNPLSIQQIFLRAHKALAKDGVFIGDFFITDAQEDSINLLEYL